MTKATINHETPAIGNVLLPAAAKWWDGLTVFKRQLYIRRHFFDDTPTDARINALYKMYSDWRNEDLEQASSVSFLPKDVTLKDLRAIRNYFGEHDKTMFEHRAYALLDSLIKHFEKGEPIIERTIIGDVAEFNHKI